MKSLKFYIHKNKPSCSIKLIVHVIFFRFNKSVAKQSVYNVIEGTIILWIGNNIIL